jgi:hypothetical protein
LALDAGIRVYAAREVADEVTEWLPVLARKRRLDEGSLLAAFKLMPVEWKEPSVTIRYKEEALRRIGDRDPDDWPTLALAIDTARDFRISGPPQHTWARWLWVANIGVRHRLNEVFLEMQSPMKSPGEPINKTLKALTGVVLYRALNRSDRLVHTQVAIWSADRDYEGIGIPSLRTGDLLRLLGQ